MMAVVTSSKIYIGTNTSSSSRLVVVETSRRRRRLVIARGPFFAVDDGRGLFSPRSFIMLLLLRGKSSEIKQSAERRWMEEAT